LDIKEVNMLTKLIHTDDDWASLVLRVMLAVVFFPHGAQKVLGWFGGYGFEGTLSTFTTQMGIPAALAVLVFSAEFLGSIGLLFGAITRFAAFGITAVMTGAIFMVHLPNGFFMNWYGTQQGEGFEFHLLAIAIALALMIKGGGRWSIDRLLTTRWLDKGA
jgi:putative oxidoreductase